MGIAASERALESMCRENRRAGSVCRSLRGLICRATVGQTLSYLQSERSGDDGLAHDAHAQDRIG